jgi:hypothetical protein
VCLFVCYFYFCSVFVLCLVFPLLSVSLDCLSHCCQCLWIVYPIVVSVSGLSIPLLSVSLDCLSHCCQCLWIVCPIVVSVSGLSIPLLSMSLDCLSHCCQCLWNVYSWLCPSRLCVIPIKITPVLQLSTWRKIKS